MHVLVSGSTGLIGEALVAGLLAAGHQPVRLVRSRRPDDLPSVSWDPAAGAIDDDALDGIDAVVHLAGEGIAEQRWTAEQKARILDSRVAGTTLLAERIAAADPPAVFISGSAIGFYGDRGDEHLTESSGPGDGFLAEVVRAWEASTGAAEEASTRVVHVRTGIVLSGDGGALAPQLPFFKLGLGGRIGSGRQWWSWISIDDMVGALIWLLTADEVDGPVNLTSPNPVTNREFTKVLGNVLRRPTVLPIPKPALWLRLGRELTEELLYASQRVEPTVLRDGGYEFRHREVEAALRAALDRPA